MAEEGGVPLEGEAGIATPPQPSFEAEAIYSGAEGHGQIGKKPALPTVIIDSEHPPARQYGQIGKKPALPATANDLRPWKTRLPGGVVQMRNRTAHALTWDHHDRRVYGPTTTASPTSTAPSNGLFPMPSLTPVRKPGWRMGWPMGGAGSR